MPRPNKGRTIETEAELAKRIAFYRAGRGMSLEGLAKRMADLGCAIQPSAIYKIEQGEPPRRITVNELIGFSRALGVPVEELLASSSEHDSIMVRRCLEWVAQAEYDAMEIISAEREKVEAAKESARDYLATPGGRQAAEEWWAANGRAYPEDKSVDDFVKERRR